MITIDDYIDNPCYMSSMPYWKYITFEFPPFMKFVHDDNFKEEMLKQYNDEVFFRISHPLVTIPKSNLANQFKIITVNPHMKVDEIVSFINRCYADIGVCVEQVASWRQDKVFDPDLWVWIIESVTNQPVALGIADLDQEVGEGILEWIQVLPQYWRMGIGKLVVIELLHRIKQKAKFATVSGKLHNDSNPEALYRSCGFIGDDLWHILSEKQILNRAKFL